MRYLVVSDLHVGDGSRADDFGLNDEDFMDWVDFQQVDKVILAGDVYELWQFKFEKIADVHYSLSVFLGNCINLRGNHDFKLIGKLTHEVRSRSGARYLISHGFQNDPFMRNPLARGAIWALTFLERIFPWIDNEHAYNKKRKKTRVQKLTKKYAEKMLKTYDVVICGHTHKPGKWTLEDGVYANCGSCQGGEYSGVIFDTDTDEITLIGS